MLERSFGDFDLDALSVIAGDEFQLDFPAVASGYTYTPGTILTSTLWNQSGTIYISVNGKQTAISGYSYNKFCPYVSGTSGSRSVTGCSNTADSQLLYYWLERGYDLTLTVSSSDYFVLHSTGDTIYVSDNPLNGEGAMSVINSLLADPDLTSGDFIAALNYYCGVKNHSSYGSSTGTTWWVSSYYDGTNAPVFKAAGFDSYFFVNSGMENEASKKLFQTGGLSAVGFSVVRENLDYGEVIRVGIPGHAIYMDGYRLNEKSGEYEYHLNYGWGTGTANTKWYTVAQLEDLELTYVTIDLSPDIYVRVTDARSDYYGGSFLRGMERINHIRKDKATTFSFAEDIAGKNIELSVSAAFTSAVDLEFCNFNVNFITSADTGFSSDDAMSFNLTDGCIAVNSQKAAKAIYESGSEKLTVNLDKSWIFAGYNSNGTENLISLLEKDDGYNYSVMSNLLDSLTGGYAVSSGDGDDVITLSGSSAIFGAVDLGGGNNTITVENGSLLYGKFTGKSGTLTVNMQISRDDTGALVVMEDAASESSFLSAAGNRFNVSVDPEVSTAFYTLYTGVDASAIQNIKINLTVGSKSYTLDRNNQAAGNCSLIYDGNTLRLEYSGIEDEPVKIFRSGSLISAAKSVSDLTIQQGGNDKMYISRGGFARNTTVNSNGTVHVYNGGSAADTFLESTGVMVVMNGGKINNTRVSSTALYLSGGSANNTEVSSGGKVTVLSGGTASVNRVNGTIVVSSGAVASRSEIYSGGVLDIFGRAFTAKVFSGGVMGVHSGGSAVGTVVSSGGKMNIWNGAAAQNVSAASGALVSGMGTVSGMSVNSGAVVYLDSGTVLSGSIVLGGSLNAYRAVNAGVKIKADGATVDFRVDQRRISDTFIIDSLETLTGAAYTITIQVNQELGTYSLAAGAASFNGSVTVKNLDGTNYGTLSVNGEKLIYGNYTYALVQSSGKLYLDISALSLPVKLYRGGEISSQMVMASKVALSEEGNDAMVITSGGSALETTVGFGGVMTVSSGGAAQKTVVEDGGNVAVSSGGKIIDTVVSAGGELRISGGSAADTVVCEDGSVNVFKGGVVQNTTIYLGGSLFVESGGSASGTVTGGDLFLTSGAAAFDTKIEELGYLEVCNSAYAANTVIEDDGFMMVFDGGKAADTKITDNGYLSLGSSTIHRGTLYIAGNGVVDVEAGAKIDFTVADRSTVDGYLINDLSLIEGAPTYTVTVDDQLVSGTYKLAQGASNFTGTLTIGNGSVNYGSITVNGADFVYNGVTYSLDQLGGDLTLTIGYTKEPGVADNDLDNNGLADVVLVHTKQGYSGAWLTTGDKSVIKWGSLSNIKDDVELLGTGKLYGTGNDGQDIFFADGKSVGAWKVVDGKVTGYQYVMGVNSTTNVLGLGDFNGDGAADILLRSTSGDLGYFGTDGTGWHYLKGLGKEWSVAAVGDLNGDGLDDTVLRHDAGFAGTFLTQADGTVKWANLDTLSNDMTIVGTGDFNGDGVDDLLLQKADGWVGAWLVEDGSVDGFMGICKNTNSIEQIADFNGDGIDDLRIRTATGDIGVLYVNGADDTTWQYFQSVGSEWETKFSALA